MEFFAKRLPARLATCFLLAAVGCSETDDGGDDTVDSGTTIPTYDAGTTPVPTFDAGPTPLPTLDSGIRPIPVVDSGTPVDAALPDSGSTVNDSGTTKPDASTMDGGGFMFPDLFPVNDAGPAAPTSDGGRNVNGPCKDLNLICFDFVDMWINAECATCNSGKGCQGCAIPFAY